MKKILYILGGIIILIIIFVVISGTGGEKKETQPEQQLSKEQETLEISEEEATWHEVISFSGISNSENKKTQPFKIKGEEWRIRWSFEDSGEFGDETNGLFIVNIYRVGDSVITDQFSHTGLSSSDMSYIYEGEGEFYLDITTANAKSWSITVEDLY